MGLSHGQLGMSVEVRAKNQARDTNDQLLREKENVIHSMLHGSAINHVYTLTAQT